MKTLKSIITILLYMSLCMPLTQAQSAPDKQQEAQANNTTAQDVLIIIEQEQVRFTAQKAVAEMHLQVFDQAGQLLYDSGAVTEPELKWVLRQVSGETVKSGLYAYTLSVKEEGAETARVRRGHFIVDWARERDGQTDRLWVASLNDIAVGTDLTVSSSEGVMIAGASATSEHKSVKADDNAQPGREAEPKTRNKKGESETHGAATALSAVDGRMTIQGSDDPLLEIDHSGGSGNPAIWFKQDGTPKAYLWWDQYNERLNLGTYNANPIMSLLNNGNVGSRVEIYGQNALNMVGYQPFLSLTDSNAGWARIRIQNVNGGINFQTHYLTQAGGSAMYIQNGTQNIGIGTADPQARLHVQGTTMTSVLQITGGADFAENFEVNSERANNGEMTAEVEAGMVVSIDPANPGKLQLSAQAYDRRVAGVISGAGGVKPGMVMSQEGTLADGNHPVALSGRVYCWADASRGAIEVGDLLTTSSTPGHAMKVADAAKAQGAIIGKAMTGLKEGKGLVLVLVTLQ